MFRSINSILALIVLSVYGYAQVPVSNKPGTGTQPQSAQAVAPLPGSYSTGIKVNHVRTREAMGPYGTEADFNAAATAADGYKHVKEATQYLDGLGRPLQAVLRQITPRSTPRDLVTPVVYDELGRELFKYLPYIQTTGSNTTDGVFKLNPFADQDHFYKNVYKDANNELMYAGEQTFYSKTNMEASPLNRVLKSLAPGNNWAGNAKGIEQKYLVNTAAEAVQIWSIGFDPLNYTNDATTNTPTTGTTAIYADGQLYKNVSLDEHDNAVVEYKDKEGQVLLKKVQVGTIASDYSGYTGFLCTYYVYDDLNQLRFVIPPKAVAQLQTVNWQLQADVINELGFRYEYDHRKRMIAKKIPGAGWVYMVYDQRDRLVLSQDANMKVQNWWLITLYDQLNRPVMTAKTTYSGTRDALQNYVDGLGLTASSIDLTGAPTPSNLSANAVFNVRETGRVLYQATNSIRFEDGFESEVGAEFVAEIVANTPGTFNDNVATSGNPVPPGSGLYPLTITHYDDYQWTNKTYDAANNSKLTTGNNLHAESVPTASSVLTRGMVTGTRAVVIEDPVNPGSGPWLTTANFYDDQGRVIQSQSDNYKGGTDIVTNRYDFTGKVLSSYMVHNNPPASVTNLRVKTNMEYDHAGRLLEIKKEINDDINTVRSIAKNEYDDLGHLKRKSLGQKRNPDGTLSTDPLEVLNYNYNIRGWLTGINKKYSKVGGTNDKWFGMELNYDWGFDKSYLNGNISGTKWRSQGDGEYRAYGFTYDQVNRLLGGDFVQYEGSAYGDNIKNTNFDMVMGDGQNAGSAYDENGNIIAMKQWGLKLGSSPIVDQLTYNYLDNSNKLRNVIDAQNDPLTKLGDFRTSTLHPNSGSKTIATVDYTYDPNGNLKKDLNKDIGSATAEGIEYNHLNLPYKITVRNAIGTKGTITYIYDATGNKLEKRVTDNTNTQDPDKNTAYVNGFVYEESKLQFFGHEEGRIRSTVNAQQQIVYDYDYFIKDHLGNTRTVLTDEVEPPAIYQAGMETAARNFEVALFGDKINNTAVNKPGGFDNITDGSNEKVSQVNGDAADKTVGPGIVLKVMAGDKIQARTYAWYQPAGMDNSSNLPLSDVVTNLLSQLVPGISGAGKGSVAQLTNGIVQPGMETFMTNQPAPQANAPKAYLNWVLLDEEYFKPVAGSYGAVPVPSISGTTEKQLLQALNGGDIEITKNGYIYVYVSNESKGNVYFDDIRVEHVKGPLLEETHYYPFGVSMAGISSKAIGKLENKRKFNAGSELQNKEFSDGSGLEMYDTKFRGLDPQIGRWWQLDPKPNLMESPYVSMGNNPVSFNDPLGDTLPSGKHIYDSGGWEEYERLTNPNYDGYDPDNVVLNLSMKERLYLIGHAIGIATPTARVSKVARAASTSKKSVWELNALERGINIEQKLGGNLPKNFPTIDKFADGVATSIKSVDLTAKSYTQGNGLLSTLKGYINKLGDFKGAVFNGATVRESAITSKVLEVAIQPGKANLRQWEQIADAMKYAQDRGVQLNLSFVR